MNIDKIRTKVLDKPVENNCSLSLFLSLSLPLSVSFVLSLFLSLSLSLPPSLPPSICVFCLSLSLSLSYRTLLSCSGGKLLLGLPTEPKNGKLCFQKLSKNNYNENETRRNHRREETVYVSRQKQSRQTDSENKQSLPKHSTLHWRQHGHTTTNKQTNQTLRHCKYRRPCWHGNDYHDDQQSVKWQLLIPSPKQMVIMPATIYTGELLITLLVYRKWRKGIWQSLSKASQSTFVWQPQRKPGAGNVATQRSGTLDSQEVHRSRTCINSYEGNSSPYQLHYTTPHTLIFLDEE